MDYELYEIVVKYYKWFCTKTSDSKNFFADDSSFFFIGESGQTLIAYGKEDIEQLIEEQFWNTEVSKFGNTLIAFNINIEKKELVLCPKKVTNDEIVTEVAVCVVANLKSIHTEKDIKITKQLGRRFVQTFVIQSNTNEVMIKSTFFSYLVPTYGLLNTRIKTKSNEANTESGDEDIEDNKSDKDLNFQQIVDTIDKLIDESDYSDIDLSPTKVEANRNELMPISVDEVFADNSFDDETYFIEQLQCEQYLKDIWSHINRSEWNLNGNYRNCKELDVVCNQDICDNQNNSTSFADVLRDNLQSFQMPKSEDKSSDLRIIANYAKPKLKAFGDRRYEFCGQQNITIMGAQNLEDFADNQIVFVANIPIGYSKTEFKRIFETFGKVLSIKFVERIGVFFGFVYFESSKCVDEVMKSMVGYNNLFINGLTLKVERYKRRIPTNVTNN